MRHATTQRHSPYPSKSQLATVFRTRYTPAAVRGVLLMGSRADLMKKIEKKQQEIADLETQIREARIFVQAYEEVLKILPRDDTDGIGGSELQPNSAIAKARDA